MTGRHVTPTLTAREAEALWSLATATIEFPDQLEAAFSDPQDRRAAQRGAEKLFRAIVAAREHAQ
jgi:hypothetical protein